MVAIQMLYLRAIESLRTLRDEEEGQGLVEYALILAVISVLIVAALTGLREAIEGVFTDITNAI